MTQELPDWARPLGFQRHPEGGWFAETWRSPTQVPADLLPDPVLGGYPGPRSLATAIYFLLLPGEESAWHRVRSAGSLLHRGALELALGGTGDSPGQPGPPCSGSTSPPASGRSCSCRPGSGRPPGRSASGRAWSAAWWRPASTSPTSRWPPDRHQTVVPLGTCWLVICRISAVDAGSPHGRGVEPADRAARHPVRGAPGRLHDGRPGTEGTLSMTTPVAGLAVARTDLPLVVGAADDVAEHEGLTASRPRWSTRSGVGWRLARHVGACWPSPSTRSPDVPPGTAWRSRAGPWARRAAPCRRRSRRSSTGAGASARRCRAPCVGRSSPCSAPT